MSGVVMSGGRCPGGYCPGANVRTPFRRGRIGDINQWQRWQLSIIPAFHNNAGSTVISLRALSTEHWAAVRAARAAAAASAPTVSTYSTLYITQPIHRELSVRCQLRRAERQSSEHIDDITHHRLAYMITFRSALPADCPISSLDRVDR